MRTTVICFFFILTLLLPMVAWQVPGVSHAASRRLLQVIRVTPSGEVPVSRQIVIQFNRPVVPLGRMARTAQEIPIEITPPLHCQWRWLNTSALACQLDQKAAPRPSQRYTLVIHPGIIAEDGATLPKRYAHEFITERPRVRQARFYRWKAPGRPVIRLTFNQSVSQDSVLQHLFLVPEDEPVKRYDLQAEPDPHDREQPRFFTVPGEPSMVLPLSTQKPRQSDDDPRRAGAREARRVWLVSAQEALPLKTRFSLKVEPGLVSALGPEPGVTSRTVMALHTFPEFTFLGIRCQNKANRQIVITRDNATDPHMKCNPLKGVALSFSAPVLSSEIKQNVILRPDLAGGRPDYDPWANTYAYSRLRTPYRQDQAYNVFLPERLRAAQTYHVVSDPGRLKDEFGRELAAPMDLTFFTDHRNPHYTLVHNTAVLEKHAETDVPLYVTNLDRVTLTYKRLTPEASEAGQTLSLPVPQAPDMAFAMPLKVRDVLGAQSGALYGKIDASPQVLKAAYQRTLFAQVTPYAVHVKLGHFNTVVWVTDLATGEPVPDASVRIYKDALTSLSAAPEILSTSITDSQGLALLAGTATLDPELKTFGPGWYDDQASRVFVRVDKGKDLALVPLDNRRFSIRTSGVSGYTVHEREKKIYGHMRAWGTTAQGVYRAGDTIQYKLYVRNQDNDRLVTPPRTGYTLEVIDPQGKTVHEVKSLTLSDFGGYYGEFTVPPSGVVGWYGFQLTANFTTYTWWPMRVLVSDFTPASFWVTNELNGDLFGHGAQVDVSTRAQLHAGGPYTNATTRVTATLQAKRFASQHATARGFVFQDTRSVKSRSVNVFQTIARVNDQGELRNRFAITPKEILYGSLVVESAVQDDRGKYVATTSTADYVGVDRFVGLKNTAWLYPEDEAAAVQYLVVDARGQPVQETRVRLEIARQVTKASRVKGAGNAYLRHVVHQWVTVGTCSGTSTLAPAVCAFTPQEPGSYRITARIADTRGAGHTTQIFAWVIGKGRVLWTQKDDNSLQIIAESERYRVGETARYLIQNPFPGAKALVTIERYGVIKHWVQTLESSTPVLEFPVQPDYLPGFFLSVLVMSPRVDKPLADGQVDLGKPTFRMGYVTVPVHDPYKEIQVHVGIERAIYKPKETVRATLHAKPRHPGAPEPIELAVAVLDEAVFDLLANGRRYFDPYAGFYRLDGLDLRNFNLLTRLVGRQKFEKKGASPGGDGGSDLGLRSWFKFVSYWNPSLQTNAAGQATITFEVPDNLTGWRLLAMAVTPTDRMGLGEGHFKVNRPTEVRPVMPNQVTAGDQFTAGFSVMNRTDQPRTLVVRIAAEGDLEVEKTARQQTQNISLAPYKRTTVWMHIHTQPVDKNRDLSAGEVRFRVTAGDEVDRDGLLHALPVNKRRGLETAATYGSSIADRVDESLLFPHPMHTDVGRVSVVASPTVMGHVKGVFQYMRDYPYSCWEQILSQGVMASHYTNLRGYLPADFAWPNSTDWTERMLGLASGYQAPNGGMVYYRPLNPYVSPYLSAYTGLAFNWLRHRGYRIPEPVEQKLHHYLSTYLRRDVAPSFYSPGLSSTVRAVALAALVPHGRVDQRDIDRFQPHVPFMSLFGKAHYLQAALGLGSPGAAVTDVTDMILGQANQAGGKVLFNEELDDTYQRILDTPLRANCAILTAFMQAATDPDNSALIGNAPFKLVRSIMQARGNRDHWENTQENLFCLNALIDYSRVHEGTSLDMRIRARLDQTLLGETHFTDVRDQPVRFERGITQADAGRRARVTLERQGNGRVYYTMRIRYAPLAAHTSRVNAGLDLRREYSVERGGQWVLLGNPLRLKRGEQVRVDIYLSLPTARHFVVVDDPVPGGLEPLNRDLATTSTVDADRGKFQAAGQSWWFHFADWHSYNASRWSFYHTEMRHDAVRFYSDYLQAGNYHLSYTAQAIASGTFVSLPVHAQEMYDPDIYGTGIPTLLHVEDK
ncbi:hypothetical protein NKDENANG_03981 [Candidatus Entotheonellaceae bacterium PAL068K]